MDMARIIDWQEEYKEHPERWNNLGRLALESLCNHYDKDKDNTNVQYSNYCDKCDVYEDTAEPMMSYGYVVRSTDFEDSTLKEIVYQGLTIMENTDTGECFLALCGGGMDLSGHIAYCYYLLGEFIPHELAMQYSQSNLSNAEYDKLNDKVINQLKTEKKCINDRITKLKTKKQEDEFNYKCACCDGSVDII